MSGEGSKRVLKIALIGKHANSGWREQMKEDVVRTFLLGSALPPLFLEPIPILRFIAGLGEREFLSETISPLECNFASELMVARDADVIVYANDGKWDKSGNKDRHLEKLTQANSILVIWEPPNVNEEKDGDTLPVLSGVVNIKGDSTILGQLLLFLHSSKYGCNAYVSDNQSGHSDKS